MIINHNMNAMNAHRQMIGNTNNAGRSMEKLSSGLRINRAGDDAAGLAISEKMRGQIRGLDQASRNAQDSISMIQTAEGALSETHSILQRMRELSVQASNDTNNDTDRKAIQDEVKQLKAEIDRIGNTTEFNTKKLLDGSVKGVVDKVDGTFRMNNNSSVKFTASAISNVVSNTTIKNSTQVTGAFMLIRVSGSVGATFSVSDFKMVTNNGSVVNITGNTGKFSIGSTAVKFGSSIMGSSNTLTLSTDTSATGVGLSSMKVGESITFVFGKHEAAQTLDVESSLTSQIGANSGQTAFISIKDMRSKALGIDSVDVSTKYGAATAIETIQFAIEKVSSQRSSIGAVQNRLEHTINNLSTASENLQSSESRIRDVDMAKEMMTFSKNNILAQAAQSMLAQANQQPQGVLQLLR